MILKNVHYYDFISYQENVYIVFGEKIEVIGLMKDFKQELYPIQEIIDAEGHLIMPSLVVAHTHIYSALARGLGVIHFAPKDFRELLTQLWWRLDAQLDIEEIYYSGIVYGIDLVKNGVTTIIDHHASGRLMEGSLEVLRKAIVDALSLRGAFCFETSDRFDVNACIRENVSFAQANQTDHQRGFFGAHASLSLSDETLKMMKENIHHIPIHIHVAESLQDQEECQRLYGERVIERLGRFGLLNEGSILSHCIHIDDHERAIIHKNDCVVAVNISSNMNNGVGMPDILKLKNAEIKVIIGNDGIAPGIVNEWATILFGMHHLYQSPTSFTLEHLREMIVDTYGVANNIFHTKLGRIEEGYAGDLLMIPYSPPTPLNDKNALGHIVFGLSSSFKPRHVFCGGKWIVKDYEVSAELRKEYQKAKEKAAVLWEKIDRS